MSSEILYDGGFENSSTGALPSSPPLSSPPPHLLSTGWYSTSSASPIVQSSSSSSSAHSGDKYLQFASGSVNTSSASQNLSISSNVDYRLSYWVRTSGSFGANDYFQVLWYGNPSIIAN